MTNRRYFLKQSAIIGAASLLPLEILAAAKGRISPNDKIGLGLIGCKGMGWSNLKALLAVPEVNCVALCDIDERVLNERKSELASQEIRPKLYGDYRKMLEDKDVDIVIVGTPDHWHCLQMIDACDAGKDVYCEKPLSNTIYEAQLMEKAVHRYKRIVQVGQWQRSQQHFNDAIAYVHSGKLGKISSTKSWMYNGNSKVLPVVPNMPVPQGVDYAMWLGPAQMRAFNPNRFHYEFRWFWDYAGGLMTDWGVHLIDMVLMGMKAGIPRSVMATGGKFAYPNDARETPDILTALYDFGDFQMSWEHNMATGMGLYGMGHGIAFIGENGTLLLNRSGWEVKPNNDAIEAIPWTKSRGGGLLPHTANFIEAVKSRDATLLKCPVEAAARVAIVSHFGNVALRSGEKIYWNEAKNKFNSGSANQLIKPDYHNGWKIPRI